MAPDAVPVNGVGEERVDMPIGSGLVRPVQDQVLPVADAGQQLDAEQVGQAKDRCILAVGVRGDRRWLDVTTVLEEGIEQVRAYL